MTQRFREARRAYAAVTPAGYCLQYNTYQALISSALKVGAASSQAARQPHRSGVHSSHCGGVEAERPVPAACHPTAVPLSHAACDAAYCFPPRAWLLQVGDLEAALDTFRDLQSLGLTANVVTYCGLISALGKERRRGVRYAQTAHELWAELAGSGAQLDSAAYRTGGCAVVGRHWEWQKWQEQLQGHEQLCGQAAATLLCRWLPRGRNHHPDVHPRLMPTSGAHTPCCLCLQASRRLWMWGG